MELDRLARLSALWDETLGIGACSACREVGRGWNRVAYREEHDTMLCEICYADWSRGGGEDKDGD